MNEMRKPKALDRNAAASGQPDPLTRMNEMLIAQALSLDAMFTELVRHAADNYTKWPTSAARYARLALRAQANCRASVETVARADRAKQRARGRGDA
jgi:hypothetical protein